MYGLDLYKRIRIDVLHHGISRRKVALRYGVDRGTVRKIVDFPEPPGYQRTAPVRRPQLDPHIAFIDQILQDDLNVPKKQRHTVQRIHDRLREERGFTGGYTTVWAYVRPRRQQMKEAFVPLADRISK